MWKALISVKLWWAYIDEGCGLKYLDMLSTVHLSKNDDKSLCSAKKIVPQAAEHTQYIMPVWSGLNSKWQAPELGKCLCNLSSDTVLLAAQPRKWKNIERALSAPSQYNESCSWSCCSWDAALLMYASSHYKLIQKKPPSEKERGKITWHHILCKLHKVGSSCSMGGSVNRQVCICASFLQAPAVVLHQLWPARRQGSMQALPFGHCCTMCTFYMAVVCSNAALLEEEGTVCPDKAFTGTHW